MQPHRTAGIWATRPGWGAASGASRHIFLKRANERPAGNQQTGEAAIEYDDSRLIPEYGKERELFAADKHSFRAAETGNDDAALFFLSLL